MLKVVSKLSTISKLRVFLFLSLLKQNKENCFVIFYTTCLGVKTPGLWSPGV